MRNEIMFNSKAGQTAAEIQAARTACKSTFNETRLWTAAAAQAEQDESLNNGTNERILKCHHYDMQMVFLIYMEQSIWHLAFSIWHSALLLANQLKVSELCKCLAWPGLVNRARFKN